MPKSKPTPKKQNKLLTVITSKKWRPAMVILAFALIGGGYMAYRSFAYVPVSAKYVAYGQSSGNAYKMWRQNIQTVVLRPGGSVSLPYYPLTTGRYDICLKARSDAKVSSNSSLVVFDAENSNNNKERANGYSQYSIRIINPNLSVPYASVPTVKKGIACTPFNFAVYNPAGTVDRLGSKAPLFTFTAPASNKTNIEFEAVVVAYKSGLDGR